MMMMMVVVITGMSITKTSCLDDFNSSRFEL